jgi:hypothetical protein
MTRAVRKSDLSEQVVVRLSRDLRDALELRAAAERRNPSQLVRIFIEDALAGRQQEHGAAA